MTRHSAQRNMALAGIATVIGAVVLLAGDLTLEGNLKVEGTVDAASNRVVNVAAPTAPGDAATKAYVDMTATTNALTLDDLMAVLTNLPPRGGISMGIYTNR